MEENRTVVLMATMRSPIIGSPDQTEKRPLLRQEGSTSASDRTRFSRMRGVPEGGHTTESGRSPVRSQLRPFSSTRSTHPSAILIGRSPLRPTIARDAGGRWSVPASPRPGDVHVKPFGWSGHPPVTNVARNCVPSVRTGGVGIHPQSNAGACGESAFGAAGCGALGSGSMCRWRRSAGSPNTSLPGLAIAMVGTLRHEVGTPFATQ